jgi:redox-sensitive bicupin YhaK (pirin superfamily)
LILALSGEPLREQIASYGPFVMNTQEELWQAFRDYREGRMGELA